ncbi:MAG: nitroreductase family protein [Sphingomonadaceae bacterium]|nr:nitroreductase family protein [Sphingomonadaceae bacterium]
MTTTATAASAIDEPDLAEAFRAIVARRRSVRAFEPTPVPEAAIRDVFELAQWSPSNCNTQPWAVRIASGATRDRIAAALLAHIDDGGHQQGDLPYLRKLYPSDFKERQVAHILCQQQALGIDRDDKASRMDLLRQQLSFFGAPHVAFLFMPAWGNEREASDVGMFAQSLLLGLAAFGLAGLPQTLLGLYAPVVRPLLEVGEDMKLLFGISFGYEAKGAPGVRLDQTREPWGTTVRIMA